jgi:hypothetical protein
MTVLWQNDCRRGVSPIIFFIVVLVGLKEACMLNFSFSGTSPGQPGSRVLDISKLRLTHPSLAGSWAELGNKSPVQLQLFHHVPKFV